MESAGLTAQCKLTLRGLHTGCRTKELRENDTYLEMFVSQVSVQQLESEFALEARVSTQREVFSWGSGQLRTRLRSATRRFSTSRTDLPKPQTARTSKPHRSVRCRRCLQPRPRHAVILFTMRRGGAVSPLCLRAVGGKAAASLLTLPPAPTVSSSLLWFQFSRP